MSKRVASSSPVDGFISKVESEKVLGVLCVKYGFCLPALWHARLENNPPKSVLIFVDTVFHAEGLDPETADIPMYNAMHEEVRKAFERSMNTPEPMTPNKSLERTREG